MLRAQLWLSSMLARGWPPCLSPSLREFAPPAPQLLTLPLPWLLFYTLSLCDLTDFHNFSYHLCYFPRTATTKYHSQSGLKQQRFIISSFWRLEVWNQGIKRATLPQGSREGYLSPLPASGVAGIPWHFLHRSTLSFGHHMAFCMCLSLYMAVFT